MRNKHIGGKLPPCAEQLGNDNPLIKDGKIIFRNMNRLFYFISISFENSKSEIDINIQISLPSYVIGLFIDQIERNVIKYNKTIKIHKNIQINDFIHNCLNNPVNLNLSLDTEIILVYSNNNAILNPLTYRLNITKNNFLILLAINRIENEPGLFFINNSYVREDIFNIILSEIDICFPDKSVI